MALVFCEDGENENQLMKLELSIIQVMTKFGQHQSKYIDCYNVIYQLDWCIRKFGRRNDVVSTSDLLVIVPIGGGFPCSIEKGFGCSVRFLYMFFRFLYMGFRSTS